MAHSPITPEELIRARYGALGGLAEFAVYLEASARGALQRTKLIPALDRAIVLKEVADTYFAGSFTNATAKRRHSQLFKALSECLTPVVDDVLLISSFEMQAKADLLRRGYVVHELSVPKDIAKAQRKIPIHRNTIRAMVRSGSEIKFKPTTISLSVLLEPDYLKQYPMPPSVSKGLEEVRQRRNLVHFQVALVWSVATEVLALARHLDHWVPIFVNGRRTCNLTLQSRGQTPASRCLPLISNVRQVNIV